MAINGRQEMTRSEGEKKESLPLGSSYQMTELYNKWFPSLGEVGQVAPRLLWGLDR